MLAAIDKVFREAGFQYRAVGAETWRNTLGSWAGTCVRSREL